MGAGNVNFNLPTYNPAIDGLQISLALAIVMLQNYIFNKGLHHTNQQ